MRRWLCWTGSLAVLLLANGAARANSALWFDPDLGCGRGETFEATSKLADLPGCSGTLPPKSPEVEVRLHDLKHSLFEVTALVDDNKLESVDSLLDDIHLRLSHTPPANPDLPDRWTLAQPLYERAVAKLRARRRLGPRLVRLRAAYLAATTHGQRMTERERDNGAAETIRLARECIAEFAEARTAGIDLTVEAELVEGRRRKLEEALADCEKARDAAEPLARAEEIARKARREEWRKMFTGDRLQVFDAHPGQLPDPGSKKRDPKTCSTAKVWCYTTAAGNEVFVFKGKKLVKRSFVPYAAPK